MYINYGCGFASVEGWKNFDASLTLRFERIPIIGKLYTKNNMRFPENIEYGDITKGLPLAYNSCNGIYCSHILEHLSLEECRVALKNSYNYLKKNKIFRFVLPDLEYYINNYINDINNKENAAIEFMENTYLGKVKNGNLANKLFSKSHHLWMWDYVSIKKELENIGFKSIRRSKFGDSIDPEFNKAEDIERFKNALAIECTK